MSPSEALHGAFKTLGGSAGVAKLGGLKTTWGAAKWLKDGLPNERVLWLSEQTQWRYTPHQLAPALYPHPDDGLPPHRRTVLSAQGAAA